MLKSVFLLSLSLSFPVWAIKTLTEDRCVVNAKEVANRPVSLFNISRKERHKILQYQLRHQSPKAITSNLKKEKWGAGYYHQGLSKSGVNGDFARVKELPDGRKMILFGDAEGHSENSASNSYNFQRFFDKEGKDLLSETDVFEILHKLDESSISRYGSRTFALRIAILNPATGEVVSSNAGMPPVYKLDETGNVTRIGGHGPPLGMKLFKQIGDPAETIQLGPGETLVFVSDGITDAPGVTDWDLGAFLKARYTEVEGRPQDLSSSIIRKHPHRHDDRSVLILRRPK